MNILKLINRNKPLFLSDISKNSKFLQDEISRSRFLVIGGAGSIGQAVVKELFKRKPKSLHVVDISENNLVELVRDLRSSIGYIEGDFKTFAIDCGSLEYESYFNSELPFDYIFNLSALKHVRSEKDKYTLMRMIDVNILNTIKTIKLAAKKGLKKYFCVSTDKAVNPVNMMGASKRIMEMFLMRLSKEVNISTARFANVAFSDGSLLHGFNTRISKGQPIVAPKDVKRYFITPEESGELCIMSALLGNNCDIFFPKLTSGLKETTFSEIALNYLDELGYTPKICHSEEEAREMCNYEQKIKEWPCLFTTSDTTGEKSFEEFYTNAEEVDNSRFENLGVIINNLKVNDQYLDLFISEIDRMKKKGFWSKEELVALFKSGQPNFQHTEMKKNLDDKM